MGWLAVFFTFALGPLQWITLLDVGLSLKPMHPPFFLAAAIGWFRFSQGRVPMDLVRAIMPFILIYSAYLSILLLSVLWGGTLTYTFKYLIYFMCSLGFIFLLSTYRHDSLMRLLFWSGVSSSLFFIRALIQGNPQLLQFMVFRNLFNNPESLDGNSVGVALRHTSLGFVYIGFMLAACLPSLR